MYIIIKMEELKKYQITKFIQLATLEMYEMIRQIKI